MNTINVNQFVLIDFFDLFNKHISPHFLNALYDYGNISLPVNLKETNTQRLFKHYIIYGLCSQIAELNYPKCKKITLVSPIITNLDHESCYNREQLIKETHKILKQIQKKLPIAIFFLNYPIDIKKLQDKYFRDEGEGRDTLLLVEEYSNKFERKTMGFSGIKDYAKKYGLNFLTQQYFNEFAVKKLLYS